MAANCQLYPEVNGEISKMYVDLLKLIGDRSTTNLIYASYLQSGVAAQMDSLGYSQNSQQQHKAKDLYKFFDVDSILRERATIEQAKKSLGAVDTSGNPIPITDPVDALSKVKSFNDSHTGLVANMYFDGREYWYYVGERNANTASIIDSINKNKKVWDYLDSLMNSHGINFTDLANDSVTKAYINPSKAIQIYSNLMMIQSTDNKYLDLHAIKILAMMHPSDAGIMRLNTLFGNDLNRIVDEIKAVLTGRSTLSTSQQTLIKNTINRIKTFPNLDLMQIKNDVTTMVRAENSNTPAQIVDTLKQLAKDYHIDIAELNVKIGEIKTLEQAATKAYMTLERRRRELKNIATKTADQTAEYKLLIEDLDNIARDLTNHKYMSSCMTFLANAQDKLTDVSNLMSELTKTLPTEQDTAFHRARIMQEIRRIFDGYYDIVKSLTNLDNLNEAKGITNAEKTTIKTSAESILVELDKARNQIGSMEKEVMYSLLKLVLGTTKDGKSVATLLEETNLDKSMWDNLYSFSRSSNDIVAAIGTITRNAQLKRNTQFQEIARQIREADVKLRKAMPLLKGSTEFMYEADKEHIISDIDWEGYKQAKGAYKESLLNAGTNTEDIPALMFDWVNKNTTTRVVDFATTRTERIPNKKYRKAFPSLTSAQKEYYDTIMALKARMESLLPKSAQDYYRPPQVRRSLGDVVFNPNSTTDIAKGLGRRVKDAFRWEDGSEMDRNNGTIIDGEESTIINTDYRGEEKKEIPIFHVNRLKTTDELSTDFSGAFQTQAGSCINYACMHEVVDVAEFMKDYIADNISPTANVEGSVGADIVRNDASQVAQKLSTTGKQKGVLPLLESFMEMQFYGEVLKTPTKWEKKIAPLILKSIGYSSIKALALNLKGAIANTLMGECQMIMEAAGGEFYGWKDYIWAHGLLLGLGISDIGKAFIGKGKIIDFFNNDRTSYDVLLSDLFGMMPANFRDFKDKRYYRNPIRVILGNLNWMGGYAVGEHLIHHINGYAVLNNTKVLINGKPSTMYNAFEKVGKEAPTLRLKDDVTDEYGNPITDADIDRLKHIILYVNQSCHGGMSDEDKSVLSQRLAGRSVLNFRQWMIETYARRYRDTHFDGTLGAKRTGLWKDAKKIIKGTVRDAMNMDVEANIAWKDATKEQKSNFRRALAAVSMLGACMGLSFWVFGDDDEDDEEQKYLKQLLGDSYTKPERSWWSIMGEYQTKKALFDLGATDGALIGTAMTFRTIINSPIPAAKTIVGLTYPIYGVFNGDLFKEKVYPNKHKTEEEKYLESMGLAPKEPENVWWHRTKAWALPFYKDIEEMKHFDEDVCKAFGEEQLFR